jgi:putative hydrolase of the HAD superfamily
VILDLGGVIVDVDEQRTLDAFRDLGFYNIEETYALLLDTGVLDEVETGHLSPVEFFNLLNDYSLELIPPDRLADAWNAMLVGIIPEHISLLQRLSSDFRLLVLSNTNAVHLSWIEAYVSRTYGLSFRGLFTKAYYSFELGMRKPQPEILEHVVQDQGIAPGKTLFIDDKPENVELAARYGFATELIHEGNPLLGLFK